MSKEKKSRKQPVRKSNSLLKAKDTKKFKKASNKHKNETLCTQLDSTFNEDELFKSTNPSKIKDSLTLKMSIIGDSSLNNNNKHADKNKINDDILQQLECIENISI